MNELLIFEGHKVEVIELNGQVLFNPYDVAECLDIKNVRDSIKNFNQNQVVKVKNSKVGITDFRKLHNTGENFLTESGVYKLVFKSRKPNAEKFTDWIADDVLPKIRKTGEYKSYKEPPPQSLIEYDDKIQNVEKRVEKLEDTMTIDYGQQNDLRMLGNSVVVSALGGYESNAYKSMGKKVFARLWKDYKIYFKVNSYKNTPRKKYFEAKDYITSWKPDANTSIMIKRLNAQMEVGALA